MKNEVFDLFQRYSSRGGGGIEGFTVLAEEAMLGRRTLTVAEVKEWVYGSGVPPENVLAHLRSKIR